MYFKFEKTGKLGSKPLHPKDMKNDEGGPLVTWTDARPDPVIEECKKVAREKLKKVT
jgi:hypothetical protein